MSKPVAGQWYEWGKCRRFCIANDPKGGIVLQDSDGEFSVWEQWICDELKHLPDCTGWDWQPETFPQWIDHQQKGKNRGDVAYLKRTSKESYVCVRDDGGEESYQWSYECDEMLKSGYWIQITEQQALALLDKPQRAEDPEEWVEITDPEHVLRAGVDQYYSNALREWSAIADSHGHKWCKSYLRSYRVRCRRKDLPKPKRTITVPKWLVGDKNGYWIVLHETAKPDCSVGWKEVHRVGETTYTEQEDGSWTVS